MSDLSLQTKSEKLSSNLPRLAYTMAETAKILGLSYVTVHRLLKRGKLRSSRALRHKLIPASEINRFLTEDLTGD